MKTSLAPGSRVVTDYLTQSGLLTPLEKLGFNVVGYGCTTCIGNSGPLPQPVADAIGEGNLVAAAVLSGNRNFEGRISPLVRANYLASPPLVVAYALAGRVDLDLTREPIGVDKAGKPVLLADIWPERGRGRAQTVASSVKREMFQKRYADVFQRRRELARDRAPAGDRYAWSTQLDVHPQAAVLRRHHARGRCRPLDVRGGARARAARRLGHHRPHLARRARSRRRARPGRWLIEQGVSVDDFNSYGARRGNYEVMVRGTFANTRLKNLLAPGTEGGVTTYLPDGDVTTIFEASERYQRAGVPLIVIAGAEYGTGSSRDWAAKGTLLLGVRAVIATSFERIHRSNLVGHGRAAARVRRRRHRRVARAHRPGALRHRGPREPAPARARPSVRARGEGGEKTFRANVRIDTPRELEYFEHGGILPYVLRQLRLTGSDRPLAPAPDTVWRRLTRASARSSSRARDADSKRMAPRDPFAREPCARAEGKACSRIRI